MPELSYFNYYIFVVFLYLREHVSFEFTFLQNDSIQRFILPAEYKNVFKIHKISTYYYLKIVFIYTLYWGFPGGLVVENCPAMQEAQVRSLGGEEPLEKEMATHSSVLAWRGLPSVGSQ